ncbi:sensor histidine kinase [Chelatococcus reniformis]|uniref:histidine kinase n=1 Tax=Chelatococcus reniformis TaxID=1494448 RepID=A0A916X7H0_9HYPH|nr:PAS domain-containing sensor histidine kinase [Chelatococcus reniformis]GGC45379.1 two-component sensor histidine kinase [Chelatococcus reniformis]
MAGSRVIMRAFVLSAALGVAALALYAWAPAGARPDLGDALASLRQSALSAGSATPGSLTGLLVPFDTARAGLLVLILGLVLCLGATVGLHVAARSRHRRRERQMRTQLERALFARDRGEAFLAGVPQVLITWNRPAAEPIVEGDTAIAAIDAQPRRILAFGSYLRSTDAQAVELAVERLKLAGEAFSLRLKTTTGRFIAADGRAVGGSALLRLSEISGDRAELVRTEELLGRVEAELGALRVMLDEIPQPVWVRDHAGQLSWWNAAYGRAIEAQDTAGAASGATELLDQGAREDSQRRREIGLPYVARVPAVLAGDRRMLDVVEVPGPAGSAGIATDVSELASLRDDLERQMDAHARTLDQLPTAVAIFDAAQHLVFHNSAYRLLWSLDQSFLDAAPTDGEILERLRAERRLPEEADFRQWKAGVLAAYLAVEAQDHWWYLPDGRTLRVVTNPNPQGGVTYLFDDVSERFQLESRYNGLIGVQGETLDTLREGVGVFGPDGRLRLTNPAFERLWKLPKGLVATEPHVDEIVERGRRVIADDEHWAQVREAVVGLHDSRRAATCRLGHGTGIGETGIVDCAMAPLPDGSTLLTFTDVTASARIERVLSERNEALLKASQLRDDFVHHVSYELRSPLTNIIGFVEMLSNGMSGPLNAKQRDYADHILRSSTALTAIIDDILDLASIDNGSMALNREPVDIRETIQAAARGVEDRLAEAAINLAIDVPDDIGRFAADGKRVRQILFNLLSNAIGFSRPQQTVSLKVRREADAVVFDVVDEGRGIPADIVDKVFNRFESHAADTRRRGVGLGLSIVRSFVELHGGQVTIASEMGRGTRVTCVFPTADLAVPAAAE